MNIGNELYLHLSCLAGQSLLMFSELPSELTVFDKDFHFEYSESYSGNVIGNSFIEGYQYCVPFHRSFEILLRENYHAFVLTINSNAVCIFRTNDDKYKIFDSHARDIYGRSHPQGTCVLLEAATINHVVLHFQSLYSDNSQFELKGVNIDEVPVQLASLQNLNNNVRNDELLDNTLQESECAGVLCLCRQCCAISLYSICYSVIKPCNYWDSNTVAAVVHFGTTLYNNTKISIPRDIPQKIQIHGTEIVVKLKANIKGVITDKVESKLNIESFIPHTNENTGFLIWFGNYCISCIFQATSINSMSYSILAYDDDTSCNAHYIKNIKDKSTLVDSLFNIVKMKIGGKVVNYTIQFLSCFSQLTNSERKRVMNNHRQSYINDNIAPAVKQQKFEAKQLKYKMMSPSVKQQVNVKHVNDYKCMLKEKKQQILKKRRTKYQTMDRSKKLKLLTKNLKYKKTRSNEQKENVLKNHRIKYATMGQSKRQEVLTKKMNYRKTMTKG